MSYNIISAYSCYIYMMIMSNNDQDVKLVLR